MTLDEIVSGIEAGDTRAVEALDTMFRRGLRYFFVRQFGPNDIDDLIHDTMIAAIGGIRLRQLREACMLPGYVLGIARRLSCKRITETVVRRRVSSVDDAVEDRADPAPNPELQVVIRERAEIVQRALLKLSAKDRDILTRFYVDEQDWEDIARDLHLTPTQFRLRKSRALAKFGRHGKALFKAAA